MSGTNDHADQDARSEAVRALEGEFDHLFSQVRRRIAESAERMSPGMLPGTYKVFTTIVRHESVTLSALAETLMADKGQVSRAVRELQERGFVDRTPDPADGRSSLLSPTPHGLERLAVAREPQEGTLMSALSAWEVDDINRLTTLLGALRGRTAPTPQRPQSASKSSS